MMKKMLMFIMSALLLICLLSACGASSKIRVEEAWLRPDPLMENAAGYMVIHNDGKGADTLIDVRSDFSELLSIHETVQGEDGMHSMEPVPRLEIPAGGQAILQPLSLHIMVLGLEEGLEFGQTVTFFLQFEQAGDVAVEAEIRPLISE